MKQIKFTIIKETEDGFEPVAFGGTALVFDTLQAALDMIFARWMEKQWLAEPILSIE
jgi:hypothetical protein